MLLLKLVALSKCCPQYYQQITALILVLSRCILYTVYLVRLSLKQLMQWTQLNHAGLILVVVLIQCQLIAASFVIVYLPY